MSAHGPYTPTRDELVQAISHKPVNPALKLGALVLGLAGLAIWSRMNSRTFALELEMSSGNKFYMYSKDERFIEQVIEKITAQIEDGTCGKLEVDVLAKSQHELP